MYIPKHITTTLIIILALGAGYLITSQNHPSTSDGVKISTGSVAPVSQSDTGVETDTGKRLEIVANSNTGWGMSPFGSGKPLEEEDIHKVVFKKPNLEWARTVKGITYRLGEGNPPEVAVTDIKAFYSCTTPYQNRAMDQSGSIVGCPETQYLTKEIEQALVKALQNPLWEKVVTECRDSFRSTGGIDYFDAYFVNGNILDISTIMYIDPDGRKNLTGLYDLASMMSPEPRGDALAPVLRDSECYKSRTILFQMIENVGGAYNIGAYAEKQGSDTIRSMLNSRLPRQYWLVP